MPVIFKKDTCWNQDVQLSFRKELFRDKKNTVNNNSDVQLNFKKIIFPSVLNDKNYQKIDRAVRRIVESLNRMNILTNSSEGGGGKRHGAPDYAYIEAKLSEKNKNICKKLNLILDKINSKNDAGGLLFDGSALSYGERTGYYIIGFNRKNMLDKDVKKIFTRHILKLISQAELNQAMEE